MSSTCSDSGFRYEFRVWGQHASARRQLARLADTERVEHLDDCYLLLGDRACNAKIRQDHLKIKRLIQVRDGFEQWSSAKLDLQLAPQLAATDGVRAVFVAKHRCRFRFGSIRAEATDVDVVGWPGILHTLAIEGRDLDDLVRLRASLGLAHLPNVAVHRAVDAALDVVPSAGHGPMEPAVRATAL